MPGIQVSPNGTILYKGETINQFNIEGQNLLGNRYSQATRNLPVEAISQVQVMENDQPIRALKSTVPSDRATLNIKLKSGYKMRPFGELEGGAGYGEDATWNNHLSVINIAAKNQLLLTAKMNNTGEDLSGNAVSNNINVSDLEGYVALPRNSVNAMETIFSPIPQQRYLKTNRIPSDSTTCIGWGGMADCALTSTSIPLPTTLPTVPIISMAEHIPPLSRRATA